MASDDPIKLKRQQHVKRERVMRTLTFWLRPDFVLRVVNRFQKLAGFDRAIALASGALTATIPLLIVISSVSSQLGGKDTATRIIERYELTGGGAEAVKDVFAPPTGTSTSIGILGFFFLMLAVLSFTRGVQRLFEQGWELSPLSVRNTFNGLLWIVGLAVFMGVSGGLHAGLDHTRLELGAALLAAPLAVVFLVWSGRTLTAKRLTRADLLPFAVIGAVLLTLYSIAATVYVPRLFNTYATRYGVIGAVFAMISTLFCIWVVFVVSTAAGREIRDELARIQRGEKPAEDEVNRQWQEITAQARSRWDTLRDRLEERKRRREGAATPVEPGEG
jgi:uncharacterized BrkB/YihY/UPF0761 family membrane protein